MKRKALKGLILLLLVLILCLFFSGTVKTITTAKVHMVSSQYGKLRDQISLTGFLTFPSTESILMDECPSGVTFRIKKVYVSAGSTVDAGDTLFEIEATGIEEAIQEQERIYLEAERSLLALDYQYAGLRITRVDQAWIDAYDALLLAKQDNHRAQVDLEVAKRNPDADLQTFQAAVEISESKMAQAQTKMDRAARMGISSDAYQYTMQSRNLLETISEANEAIVVLRSFEGKTNSVLSPHLGVIVQVQISEGDDWNGRTPAVILSADNTDYLLRASTKNVDRIIRQGANVSIMGQNNQVIKSSVLDAGYDTNGDPYIDVAIRHDDIPALGTANKIINDGAAISIQFVSEQSSTFLSTSAIRGTEDNRYVYIIVESQNAFGQNIYKIAKQAVTITDETSDYAAVTGINSGDRIAYMEDRPISEGSEVIPYE